MPLFFSIITIVKCFHSHLLPPPHFFSQRQSLDMHHSFTPALISKGRVCNFNQPTKLRTTLIRQEIPMRFSEYFPQLLATLLCKLSHTEPTQTGKRRFEPNRTEPNRKGTIRTDSNRTEPEKKRIKPNRNGTNRNEPNRIQWNLNEPNRMEPNQNEKSTASRDRNRERGRGGERQQERRPPGSILI